MITIEFEGAVTARIRALASESFPELEETSLAIEERSLLIAATPRTRDSIHRRIAALMPICSQVGINLIVLDAPGFRQILCTVPLNLPPVPRSLDERLERQQATLELHLYQQLKSRLGVTLVVNRQQRIVDGGNVHLRSLGLSLEAIQGQTVLAALGAEAWKVEARCQLAKTIGKPQSCEISLLLPTGLPINWHCRIVPGQTILVLTFCPNQHHPWLTV